MNARLADSRPGASPQKAPEVDPPGRRFEDQQKGSTAKDSPNQEFAATDDLVFHRSPPSDSSTLSFCRLLLESLLYSAPVECVLRKFQSIEICVRCRRRSTTGPCWKK